jgi:hypothetical protein
MDSLNDSLLDKTPTKITIIIEQPGIKNTIEIPCADNVTWVETAKDDDSGAIDEIGLMISPILKEIENHKFIRYRHIVETIY